MLPRKYLKLVFVKELKHLENYLEDMIDRHRRECVCTVWEKAVISQKFQKLKAF